MAWLERIALRLVPRDWRQAVARDLADEHILEPLAFAAHAARVGGRLRAARLRDALMRLHPRPPHQRRRHSPMRDLTRDFRFAVRGLRRHPGYALTIIATLAIGIGATTAIFSVFNWILFRPLPGVSRPGELATVRFQGTQRTASYFVSYRDVTDLRDALTSSLAGLAAATPITMDATIDGDTRRLHAEVVTANYLELLGVRPVAGRDFTTAEEKPGSAPVVAISERLWHRSFGANPAVLGQTLVINGRPFTIVGITPRTFQGRELDTVADTWMPLGSYATLQPAAAAAQLATSRRSSMFGDAIARLRPGMSVAHAQTEADAAMAHLKEFANRSAARGARSAIGPVFYGDVGVPLPSVRARVVTVFRLLMGGVALLLLLACANAANLLLARAARRQREVAVCQAIGASRLRIVRQQLVEGLVLSLAAGVAGLGLAAWLTWLFDGMRVISFLPSVEGVGIDWRVCGFALAASLFTGLVFAAAPAIVSSRVDLQSSLKDGVTASRRGRRVLRGALVLAQVTVSVLLLVAAGLFVRTLQNIRGLDLGIEPDGIVSFTIDPGRFGLSEERSEAYLAELLTRLKAAPGVEHAAFTWTTPFLMMRSDLAFEHPARAGEVVAMQSSSVSPGYFATMGTPLLTGRDFTAADVSAENETGGVVILTRRAAGQLFPRGDALGARLVMKYPEGKSVEVIGIAGDVRGRAVTKDPEGWAYVPANEPRWGTVQVRSALPTAQVVATIRQVARALDPVVAPHDIETFGASVDRALSEQRLFAKAASIFAGIAALLAGIGIYGMLSGAVAERRKEFGIRLALGAAGRSVVGLVLRTAALLAATGALCGLLGAVALRRAIESRLYGVTPFDPTTIAGTVAAVLALSLLAGLVPGMRAARVDPVRSLRAE